MRLQPIQWFPHPATPPCAAAVASALRVVECGTGFQGSPAFYYSRLSSPPRSTYYLMLRLPVITWLEVGLVIASGHSPRRTRWAIL